MTSSQRWLRSWQGHSAVTKEELLKNQKSVPACTSCMNMCVHTQRSYSSLVFVWSWDFGCLLSPKKQLQCCPGDWNATAMEAEAACLFLKLVQPRQEHPAHTWLHFNSSEITVQSSLCFPIHSCAWTALCPQLCWLLSWSTLGWPVTMGSFTSCKNILYLCLLIKATPEHLPWVWALQSCGTHCWQDLPSFLFLACRTDKSN